MTALRDEPVLTPVPASARPRLRAQSLYGEAEEFIRAFHHARPRAGQVEARLAKVREEIMATGTYRHKPAELAYGARLALRDSGWCPANVPWRGLLVRDLRQIRDSTEVATQCVQHLRMSTNDGAVRPMVSVFAPDTPWRPGPRIRNDQLVRYAGYAEPGRVLGDRRYVDFTTAVCRLGWRPPTGRTAFDKLPLVVQTPHEGVAVFPLPRDVVHEVPLEHPELPWFATLGLRWHAVPVISNRRLRIGGITYPAAPYNGVYICQAIGEDVLADDSAYGLARVIADRLGLDTTSARTLWRDRAVVELNRAVVHSFDAAGVTIKHSVDGFLPTTGGGSRPSFTTWEDASP
ncbi:nitric oxide synthase oxygenase [Actinophytocola algeriensis]|uniref:Nitric-oxide synthase n=1 Tax=Actinophytocola algeriensis TaxID=1768010 RepID=A0A7W7VE52_9PSEU|nr:nitric oxide synthase oxygenase [Actinophytocola algeriensis]MBB4906645.1 nitric-oxide synthase [Actinophytocola algeriensis]MBE1478126.1 nitric-oxide synthase [Actinophytocola algeriensis]